ncbi:MAG: putative lipase [Gammaproteobacteria bacterium]|nr:putative lipase [Gammaproteobacteria bacterium]
MLGACATPVPSDPQYGYIDDRNLPKPDFSAKIPGLSPCTNSKDTTLHLNSHEPVTVIVHGCTGSAALFRSLAEVFAFHGQQAVCFNYNDRDSLTQSSAELITALDALSTKMDNKAMTVIGHSQGGLISRRALIKERDNRLQAEQNNLTLVTISTPYAGISAADHCGSTTFRWLTLGLAVPICKLVSGDKWYEITQPSYFIQQPGTLLDQVTRHVKIVTDERGTCRKFDDTGACVEDDHVFNIEEQYFDKVDNIQVVENLEVDAGHAEIVGDYKVAPDKLIAILQDKRIMDSTPPEQQARLAMLLKQLYQ